MGDLFSFISDPLEAAIAHLALFFGGAGVAILVFTIGIRLILAPLQIVQLRSARAMQKLQPHIKELQKKHGKDRTKLTEETMKLYREHKVNPAMGCLPMLLQFPVLIGLFWALNHLGSSELTKKGLPLPRPGAQWLLTSYHHNMLPGGVDQLRHIWNLFHANFLWLNHGLGQPDPLYILPVLAGVTQWIQSRMMMQKSTDPQQQTMNMLMNFTPLIIVFFATRYASGLSLYWVTSTIIGILVSMKITGWGSLPRPADLFRPPEPARGLMPKARPAQPAKREAETKSSGGFGGGWLTRNQGQDNGAVVDGAAEEDENGTSPPGSAVPPPGANRRLAKRRRQKGGRRG